MQSTYIGNSELTSSRLVYGCMRISGDNSSAGREKGKAAIRAAIEAGYTHFDHADVYGDGESESIFSEVLKEDVTLRDRLLITSKCGIVQSSNPDIATTKRYDFSREYITRCVDDCLERLSVDYLDLLLLHRPDFLMNPEEVALTFDKLKRQGKVLNFGVSNFQPSQLSMLQKYCSVPLVANQVEINIDNTSALTDGTLDQCLEHKITPMAWCPLGGVAYRAWNESLTPEQHGRIKAELNWQSDKYGEKPWVIILAWLIKHPSTIVPIVGSTQPSRIREALQALDLEYAREDWYRLLQARNGQEVP